MILMAASIAAGWRLAGISRGGLGSRVVFALLAGSHVPAFVILLPVPFSPLTNLAGVAVLFLASLFVPQTKSGEPDSPVWLAASACLSVLTVLLLARDRLLTHYDYYLNSNLMSLDLARSGSAASPFAAMHDLHNWVLIQLTTTVTLDALEIQVLGSNTNLLPRLLQLATILACSSIISRISGWGTIVFSVLGAAILVDQSIQFRPHVFVGLFVLLACLHRLDAKSPEPGLAALAVFLALSKRDGLLLAPFIVVLSRFRPNLWRVLLAMGAFAVGAAFIRVGGRPPLLPMIEALGSSESLQRAASKIADPGIFITITAILWMAFAAWSTRYRDDIIRCCIMLAMLLMLVVGGAMVLGGAGFWNLGSDDRKVLYIVLPVTSGLLTATGPLLWRDKRFLRVTHVLLLIVTMGWSGWQFASALRVTPAWGEAAVANTVYLRNLLPNWTHVKMGMLDRDGADLAPSVLGDLNLYKFQFFVSYDGADLAISGELNDLGDRDVIFVPPSALATGAPAGFEWRRPYGLYSLLVRKSSLDQLDARLIVRDWDGQPLGVRTIRRATYPFDGQALAADNVQMSATEYPSGETNMNFAFSGEDARARISSAALANTGAQFLSFRQAVSGMPLPNEVAVRTEDGRVVVFPVETLKHYDTYYVPLPQSGSYDVDFFVKDAALGMGIMALSVDSQVN